MKNLNDIKNSIKKINFFSNCIEYIVFQNTANKGGKLGWVKRVYFK